MFVTIYLTRRLALRMQRQTPGQALTICPDICPGVANLSRRESRRLTALPNCPGVPAYFRQAQATIACFHFHIFCYQAVQYLVCYFFTDKFDLNV